MHAPVLPSLTALSSLPLSQSLSCLNSLLARIEVVERRSSCDRVTDKLEFVGRINEVFRLPQYLMTAMSVESQKASLDLIVPKSWDALRAALQDLLTGAEQVASKCDILKYSFGFYWVQE